MNLKSPWEWFGLLLVVVFGVSFLALTQSNEPSTPADTLLLDTSTGVQLGDEWMGVQYEGRKVGLLHLRKTARPAGGFHFALHTHLKLVGFDGDTALVMDVGADLTPGMGLDRFDFRIEAGPAEFRGAGIVREGHLALEIETGGTTLTEKIPLPHAPVLRANLGAVLATKTLDPGARFRFHVFDPLTRREQPVDIEVVGVQTLQVLGHPVSATHIRQRINGMVLDGWVNQRGEMLRQELGLGLVAVRETEEEARFGLLPANQGVDLIRATLIPVAGLTKSRTAQSRLRLRLVGLPDEGLTLTDRRQTMVDGLLTVTRESVGQGLAFPVKEAPAESLAADALIQSRHPRILARARRIVGDAPDTVAATRKLVAWLQQNIEQRGVMGVPSALETLENRVGDCNEHSTLFAALARSLGIPTHLVVGLVHVDGHFGYHAWNEVLTTDGWLSVDATWGQVPVDVGHLGFLRGGLDQQVRLLPLMGQLRISLPSEGPHRE